MVLKVSLNCRGCEKKVKKHISKMEGKASPHFKPKKLLNFLANINLGIISTFASMPVKFIIRVKSI